MDLESKYPSKAIAEAGELELEDMLAKYKTEYFSAPKILGFALYHFVGLSGMLGATAYYVKSRWVKRGEKGKMKKKDLTLANIVKKGSKIGLLMGGLYIGGFLLYMNSTMPLQMFLKFTEINERLHSFEIKYDPFYQDLMLFNKMKKFGLSESLMTEIRADLMRQRDELIGNKKLKEKTIENILKAEQNYKSGIYDTEPKK